MIRTIHQKSYFYYSCWNHLPAHTTRTTHDSTILAHWTSSFMDDKIYGHDVTNPSPIMGRIRSWNSKQASLCKKQTVRGFACRDIDSLLCFHLQAGSTMGSFPAVAYLVPRLWMRGSLNTPNAWHLTPRTVKHILRSSNLHTFLLVLSILHMNITNL